MKARSADTYRATKRNYAKKLKLNWRALSISLGSNTRQSIKPTNQVWRMIYS